MLRIFLYSLMLLLCSSFQSDQALSYTETIPGTAVSFEMRLIESGQFNLAETDKTIVFDSFWIGAKEVTHDMYAIFKLKAQDSEATNADEAFLPDAITRPSPPYEDLTWGMGSSKLY